MPVRCDPRTGRWFFRATVKHADGTKERVFGTPGTPGPYQDLSNTKSGAKDAERRAIASSLNGRVIVGAFDQWKEDEKHEATKAGVPTIEEYAKVFLAEYAAEHKPSEQRSKEQILNGHLIPFFGSLRLDELTIGHIKRFAAAERKRGGRGGNGCSVKTINNRLAVLSSLIKYAAENKVIADPCLKFQIGGDARGTKPLAVPMEHVDQLLSAATDDRYRAVLLLAVEAGLRAGEIRGLQWGDVADGQLTVRRALDNESDQVVLPKHDKIRSVPLSLRLAVALERLPRRGLWVVSRLDGGLLTQPGLYDAIVDLYERAGVPRPSKPIHCLRHTFGTEAAAAGVPLSTLKELMGHADIKTTLRYVDVSADQKRDAIARAFDGTRREVRPAANRRGSGAAAALKLVRK